MAAVAFYPIDFYPRSDDSAKRPVRVSRRGRMNSSLHGSNPRSDDSAKRPVRVSRRGRMNSSLRGVDGKLIKQYPRRDGQVERTGASTHGQGYAQITGFQLRGG